MKGKRMEIGSLNVRCRGNNLNKFVNALRMNAVECKEQYIRYEEYFASVSYIDLKKFKKTAKECKIEVFVESKKGVIPKILKYKKRYGVIIGLIIAMCFSFYVSNTIMIVEVKGNSVVSTDAILNAAEKLGIKKGKSVQNINYSETEKALMFAIPEISWANVQHTGNRVLISVAEIREIPKIQSNAPCNIVSTKDALLTKATVRTGMLHSVVNEAVKKGEVVISGVYYNSSNQSLRVHAEGELIGKYAESAVFRQYFKETKTEYGNVKTGKKLDFFGLRIPFAFAVKGDKNYNLTIENTPFQIFGKNIPIGIIKNNYQEMYKKEYVYSLEQANEKLEKQMQNYEYNFLEGTKILDKKTNLTATDEYLQLEVTYKLEGNIGEEVPLLIK
jgi:similar to stage IV sporulation protein